MKCHRWLQAVGPAISRTPQLESWKSDITSITQHATEANLRLFLLHKQPLEVKTHQSPWFWQPLFSYLLANWAARHRGTRWISSVLCHCFRHFTNAEPMFSSKPRSPFFIHTRSHTSRGTLTLDSRHSSGSKNFFRGGNLSALAFSELSRGTITQFKLYAVHFEEDYDDIGPIYYFTWLLMILCTQPTQLITFPMNNK